ncbi:MAG: hypothetical protein A4E72_00960 [Syntrophus sp. PtaU1.Bin208]|nr:MAG: hypothetical protein A4E72_00960 [Syntrophus sp. PtaU1.Bin208]
MFKRKRQWWWVIGTCIALSGVALVRLLAPEYPPGVTRILINTCGYALVIVGLFSLSLAMQNNP